MAPIQAFDVIVVGGGLAGSALAGVLGQAGLGVLVVEREAGFCDRGRGEFTWPWGVADALQLGLGEVLRRAGRVELEAVAPQVRCASSRLPYPGENRYHDLILTGP